MALGTPSCQFTTRAGCESDTRRLSTNATNHTKLINLTMKGAILLGLIAATSAINLTPDNWDDSVAGKTVFSAREAMNTYLRESGDLDGEPRPTQRMANFYEKKEEVPELPDRGRARKARWPHARRKVKKIALVAEGRQGRVRCDLTRHRRNQSK